MLHTKNQLPRLPRTKLRSSYIFKNIKVKIRLHTENQLPGLPGSALKVCVGWVVVVGSTQLCGHPNFVLCWSWVVTITSTVPTLPRYGTEGQHSNWLTQHGSSHAKAGHPELDSMWIASFQNKLFNPPCIFIANTWYTIIILKQAILTWGLHNFNYIFDIWSHKIIIFFFPPCQQNH